MSGRRHFNLQLKNIKEYPLSSYTSIGCYKNGFSGEGLTQAQCKKAVLSYVGKNLYCTQTDSIYAITSFSSLTIELCLQICTENGFIYAGLS